MGVGTIVAVIAALALIAPSAHAQFVITSLTLTNATITFPAPTAADYINGYVTSTGVTFTVKATFGASRTAAISIRSSSVNLGNGKALGDLQWRRSDLANWTSITGTNAQVEQRVQVLNGQNDPWNNTVYFRMLLNWATDAPATYSGNYIVTLSQTVP
jgi:hypothetical protein